MLQEIPKNTYDPQFSTGEIGFAIGIRWGGNLITVDQKHAMFTGPEDKLACYGLKALHSSRVLRRY